MTVIQKPERKNTTLRLPEDIRIDLETKAAKMQISMNALMTFILREGLKGWKD